MNFIKLEIFQDTPRLSYGVRLYNMDNVKEIIAKDDEELDEWYFLVLQDNTTVLCRSKALRYLFGDRDAEA